jgi:hypothetical protein
MLEIGMHTALTGAYSRLSSLVMRIAQWRLYFFELRRICAVPAWNNPLALRLFGRERSSQPSALLFLFYSSCA